jgi:DNA-binding beta-propeller fold protein YncE
MATPAAFGAQPIVSLSRAMVVDHDGGRVYWTSDGAVGTISYANLDGSGAGTVTAPGTTIGFLSGIAIDPVGQRLYWLNAVGNAPIGSVKLDGSAPGNVAIPASAFRVSETSLAFANGTLYWSNNLSKAAPVGFVRADGSGGVFAVAGASALSRPTGVAFDPVGQRLYWTDEGTDTITSANPDGTDMRPLQTAGVSPNDAWGPVIDPVGRRIYWINGHSLAGGADHASIAFAILDGPGAGTGGTLDLPGAISTFTLAIDPVARRIVWNTEPAGSLGTIRSANLDGSDVRVLFPVPPKPPPPVDNTLHAPVIDDAPPASTPLTDASLLYHAVDKGVALSCALDGAEPGACAGRSSFSGLAVGSHCFSVREQRNGAVGLAVQACWTVTQLAPGCTAGFHHGYFITAGAATLARRQVVFHATSDGTAGRIALTTRTAVKGARVSYRLDGKPLSGRASTTLTFAQLDRTKPHTLTIDVAAAGRHARITRRFRYASFVAIACGAREVVGRIAPRTVRVGGGRVTISAQVPKQISGTAKLRFTVKASRPGVLRAAHFSFAGKALTQHALNAALTAQQLAADGTQTLTIQLVPTRGRPITVRIAFRTHST